MPESRFKRILVANRGEIAIRIIQACKEMGIESVAVYSEADRESKHVKLADEAICIGAAQAIDSYLKKSSVFSACQISGVDAVHPGYGFLAEDPEFAQICEESEVVFIGPPSEVIRSMGNKSEARKLMLKHKVPVIPGSEDDIETKDEALRIADEIGYPVLIKASGGGGGKGMRRAESPAELKKAFQIARNESAKAFGRAEVYLEKIIENARHIEIQMLSYVRNNKGRKLDFPIFERDCSVQRRHQKLIEEAPANISSGLRYGITNTATKIAGIIDSRSAVTFEFLVDDSNHYYFLEANTRLQVEHPITEEISGLDIVKEQIRIAQGATKPILWKGHGLVDDLKQLTYVVGRYFPSGHAIECRINAEDPEKGFAPCPGKVSFFSAPGGRGVRTESHLYTGYTVPPYYDSLVAKIISHGRDREEALAIMDRALDELVIEGIKTTQTFVQKVIRSEQFRSGEYNTNLVGDLIKQKL